MEVNADAGTSVPISARRNRHKNARVVDTEGNDYSQLYGTERETVPGLESFPRRTEKLTAADANIVCQDLGYKPENLCDVGAHDPVSGVPLIARLYPLNRNLLKGRYKSESLPFPTMMWMTSAALKARVSKIEVDGYIEAFKAKLKASPEAQADMCAAHAAYAAERWSLLSEGDRKHVQERGWEKALRDTGIAGMRDVVGLEVKCLHTHTAHFLSRPAHGNIIGQWTNELLQREKYGGTETSSSSNSNSNSSSSFSAGAGVGAGGAADGMHGEDGEDDALCNVCILS